MPDLIRTAGRAFDPERRNLYFLASNVDRQQYGAGTIGGNALVAVNELRSEGLVRAVRGWMDLGVSVLLDSGVFWLTNEHARAHDVPMDEALALAPDEIDGFDWLFNLYVKVVSEVGADAWGYIELDQGGRENKLKTRARLEALGLRPIPVYHPFNDGWDYFDYLAQRYDRICFGNVVQADVETRKRLVATAWERKRKYPDLWIHLLGLTPNEWLYGYPIDSADSSTWLSVVRWSGYKERAAGKAFGELHPEYRYKLASDPTSEVGSQKAIRMSAYGSMMAERNWRNHVAALCGAGFDPGGRIEA